jgi:NADPH:quinone reductase-like Zn-dependent oxidoreductase
MKVYELKGFGLENLRLAERPVPEPGPGEVLIRMRAAALNPRDLGVIDGFYFPDLTFPFIPVTDGVGEVVGLGPGVRRFRVGDRVAGTFAQGWISGDPEPGWHTRSLGAPLDGVLAEYVVLPESGVVRVPAHLTDAEAATLPIAGLTAWQAVAEVGRVRAGDAVVVQGTGGVSVFALQFAKLHGARVFVVSGSAEKLERALALGADAGVRYTDEPDWDRRVLEWTEGRGADLVIDIGGAETLNRSVAAIRPGGTVCLIGIMSGSAAEGLELVPTFLKRARLQGINVGSRDMFEAMNRAIAAGGLRPVIDRVYPFDQAVEALRALGEGRHFGKIAIAF